MLKYWDAVLAKVKPNLTYDARMELGNAPIYNAFQLFLPELISEAVEKSSCSSHDEAIQNFVSFEEWPPQSFRKSKAPSQSLRARSSFRKHLDSNQFTKTFHRKGPAPKLSSLRWPPAGGEKERNFETFSSPSVPQVGDVLGCHWHAWQVLRAGDCTVEVLCLSYLVPFHRFPPMSLEPVEFPSDGSGCKDSGTSRSGQNALQSVEHPGLWYYSCLFLMQKATG